VDISNRTTHFDDCVDTSGGDDACWIWNSTKDRRGYGRFWYQGRHVYAHRLAWMREYGEIQAGLHVCHTCDNPSCVNHKHLFLGTHQENMRDMGRKGRASTRIRASGESNPSAKLTWSDVTMIRARYTAGGVRQHELGREYGVGQDEISRIVNGKIWKSNESVM
jgi:hypothetical protein